MTRKRNATPCPRCKLIRQEWRHGSYEAFMCASNDADDRDRGMMCWSCVREVGSICYRRLVAKDEAKAFAENEMWSLESGAMT